MNITRLNSTGRFCLTSRILFIQSFYRWLRSLFMLFDWCSRHTPDYFTYATAPKHYSGINPASAQKNPAKPNPIYLLSNRFPLACFQLRGLQACFIWGLLLQMVFFKWLCNFLIGGLFIHWSITYDGSSAFWVILHQWRPNYFTKQNRPFLPKCAGGNLELLKYLCEQLK